MKDMSENYGYVQSKKKLPINIRYAISKHTKTNRWNNKHMKHPWTHETLTQVSYSTHTICEL